MEERFRVDAEKFLSYWEELDDIDFGFDQLPAAVADVVTGDSTVHGSKKKKVKKARQCTSNPKNLYRQRNPMVVKDNSIISVLQTNKSKPNVSRRTHNASLYAFPHFDKCDSLLYFPSTFTRHVNSGDMVGLAKLFTSHVDKNCIISMFHCFKKLVTPLYFLKSYEFINELQPDRIMCVHTTKVEENQIKASVYLKFTDSKAIFDSVAPTIPTVGLEQAHVFSRNRKENLMFKLMKVKRDDVLQKQYLALVETDVDIVIYIHLSMNITFDDYTKKITGMSFKGRMTSMHAADNPPATTTENC